MNYTHKIEELRALDIWLKISLHRAIVKMWLIKAKDQTDTNLVSNGSYHDITLLYIYDCILGNRKLQQEQYLMFVCIIAKERGASKEVMYCCTGKNLWGKEW